MMTTTMTADIISSQESLPHPPEAIPPAVMGSKR